MPIVIIVERRGREDDVDAVIRRMKERFRELPEKRKNNKSGLPQACAQRSKTPLLRCFAGVPTPAMTIWQHCAFFLPRPAHLRRKSFKV
jgi:hypothetical protein